MINDRLFMLSDESGLFLSQRKLPQMAQFKTSIEKGSIRVSFEGESIEIPIDTICHSERTVTVWKDSFIAGIMPSLFNKWFSERLNQPIELMQYQASNPRRRSHKDIHFVSSFADGYPILLSNSSSLQELNRQLDTPISMDRFRPNIVVEGLPAWQELNYSKIQLNDKLNIVAKPCERCTVTTIDQNTGLRTGKEPLKTLTSIGNGKAIFGLNLALESGILLQPGTQMTFLK